MCDKTTSELITESTSASSSTLPNKEQEQASTFTNSTTYSFVPTTNTISFVCTKNGVKNTTGMTNEEVAKYVNDMLGASFDTSSNKSKPSLGEKVADIVSKAFADGTFSSSSYSSVKTETNTSSTDSSTASSTSGTSAGPESSTSSNTSADSDSNNQSQEDNSDKKSKCPFTNLTELADKVLDSMIFKPEQLSQMCSDMFGNKQNVSESTNPAPTAPAKLLPFPNGHLPVQNVFVQPLVPPIATNRSISDIQTKITNIGSNIKLVADLLDEQAETLVKNAKDKARARTLVAALDKRRHDFVATYLTYLALVQELVVV